MIPLSDIEKLERLLVELDRAEDGFNLMSPMEAGPAYNIAVRELNAALFDIAPYIIADWKQMRGEIERLERLVYVPGLWSCPKCKLKLISNTLHAGTGLVSANNSPQQCANGCGPMWRVTERDAGNDLCDRAEKAADDIKRLTKERDEAYERAAQVCENEKVNTDRGRVLYNIALGNAAIAIRALKANEE